MVLFWASATELMAVPILSPKLSELAVCDDLADSSMALASCNAVLGVTCENVAGLIMVMTDPHFTKL
jgi:hypothetical protein